MNGGGEASAKNSSSAHVVELGEEEASSSQSEAPEKTPEIVVVAIDGSKQAEIAFTCTFRVLLSYIGWLKLS